ncbi:MAG: Crp/Fnr family transcriptional regulator [Acaryochloridaceae cyanobacterium SU_2_1]|nr:Crp/Fnr family transcriptional regulator [Acaryochloridaceae cyanobacterium SU_2_1]
MEDRHNSRDARLDNLLRSLPFFAGLPDSVVEQAVSHVITREHPPKSAILRQDDWGESVYFILEGWVKIRTYNIDGKEVTLNIVGKGELVGEMACLDKVPRSTDVLTLTSATVANMPAKDFVGLMETHAQAGIWLAKLMALRLRQLNRRLRLREADARARVADILVFLAEGQGRVGTEGIEIPNLPHRELGSLSGMTRETVTRVLGRLEQKGFITRDQEKLFILDMDALEDLIP